MRTFQPFLSELHAALGVGRPRPTQADDEQNAYVFERAVTFHNPDGTTGPGRIDLHKRGYFVLGAEHGLASVLRQIHDELGAAVFDAYGWPASLTDEEVLERLVRLA